MKLTKHQEVLLAMMEDGKYSLVNFWSGGWGLYPSTGPHYSVCTSTANSLLRKKLIEMDATDTRWIGNAYKKVGK